MEYQKSKKNAQKSEIFGIQKIGTIFSHVWTLS